MKMMHMIGNAHLDPVWLWNWQEGYQENKATFKSALDRMDEFDEFIFTSSSAQFYEWIEKNEPEMFEKIKQRIKEGRWKICGGWWVQPDCNIPSGESFSRHGLLAQNYFLEKFGIMAHTGYCVDSFGHNVMLPQILKLSGMENYVFMRPDPNEKELPARAFLWQAPDGSRVRAFRIPVQYCFWEDIPEAIELCAKEYSEDNNHMMCFYGVGNHGGGPTVKTIKEIKKIQRERKDLNIVFSDPDTYFDMIEKCNLPLVKEELQYHSPGCYTAESIVKKMNRQAEASLYTAEALSVVALALGKHVDDTELTKAWKDVLFNQFHDTLAGSAIESAYHDAKNQLGEALTIASRCTNEAVNGIAFDIDIPLETEKLPMVVFNPNAWNVKAPVEFENGMFGNMLRTENLEIEDWEGKKVEHQLIAPSCRVEGRRRITFMADVPALGYALYYAKPKEAENEEEKKSDALNPYILENRYIKVIFSQETGTIESIYDKKNEREVLKERSSVAIIEDLNDTWGHQLKKLDKKIGEFQMISAKIADCGPVRKAVQFISKYGNSTLTQVFALYEDENMIRVKAKLNWQEHFKAVKLYYTAALNGECEAAVEIPYGYVVKKREGHEEPMQRWADVSNGRYGLAILNDCKYGVDFTDNRIGVTVLRSPVFAHHQPYQLKPEDEKEYSFMDQGISEFSYVIKPHIGSWKDTSVVKDAILLNQPLETMFETFHKGALPKRNSYISISADNIIMSALKKAYVEEGTVLRFYESAGLETECSIEFMGKRHVAMFRPHEIKTFLLDLCGCWKEVNLLEISKE
ncbi:MAG: alpha-mannosidase [Marvinbryantia sp.]